MAKAIRLQPITLQTERLYFQRRRHDAASVPLPRAVQLRVRVLRARRRSSCMMSAI